MRGYGFGRRERPGRARGARQRFAGRNGRKKGPGQPSVESWPGPSRVGCGLEGLQHPERLQLHRLGAAAGRDGAQRPGVGGFGGAAGAAHRGRVVGPFADRLVGSPPRPAYGRDGGAVYRPQLELYTPFVVRDFGVVPWLFTNRSRDVRHVRARRACAAAGSGWRSSGSADRPAGWKAVMDDRVAGRDGASGGGPVHAPIRRLWHAADLCLCCWWTTCAGWSANA